MLPGPVVLQRILMVRKVLHDNDGKCKAEDKQGHSVNGGMLLCG